MIDYFFNFEKIAYLKGKRTGSCILCGLRDEEPEIVNTVVHKSEDMAVSLNLYPYNPGHSLIFPTRHVEDIRELTDTERHSMDKMLDKVLTALDSLYSPAGYNIGFNMGLEAGASIKHLHLHIIPRYPRELGIAELIGGKRVLVEDLTKSIARLKAALSLKAALPTD